MKKDGEQFWFKKSICLVIKKTYTKKLPVDKAKVETPVEAFMACRLIHLVKNPGLQPIEVGEVLQRIAGKVIMKVVKEDKKVARYLQLCAHQEVGCEAAIMCTEYLNPIKKDGTNSWRWKCF